jgi:hypothetical protein
MRSGKNRVPKYNIAAERGKNARFRTRILALKGGRRFTLRGKR